MATPKYKTSKASAASRKAANMRLAAPTLSQCGTCGNMVLPPGHRAAGQISNTQEKRDG